MAYSNTPRGKRQKKLHEAELDADQSRQMQRMLVRWEERMDDGINKTGFTAEELSRMSKENLKKYQHNLELVKKAAGRRAGR